ncbi:Glycoside hydrolase [Macleaya cordata]|uniref:Glycoside hydrolase n=1 Tax=Macleaya cordata TaxID=56857 RepID=A0A200QS32_MACCD|nr:Glycoside hydrolase [Macleaya cordata]
MCGAIAISPTLFIPPEKTFLLKPVTFEGPCTAPNPQLQVLGNIVAADKVSAWSGFDPNVWLAFSNVNGLTIDGSGQIDGQGSVWWSRPCIDVDDITDALRFKSCKGLQLRGLRHLNSPRNHISILDCSNVMLSNLHIIAPKNSPNTDGIDIASSTNIHIKDSFIGTGDDCIAINGGSSFINVTNVACGPGHGISVGSLGEDGANETVEEIHVKNCNFTRTMNGARIKTWPGGSGYARKISFAQITLVEVKNPIIIDQYYCNGEHNCKNETSALKVSDVTYSGIHGTSVNDEAAINLNCSQAVPCSNIVMNQINIQSTNPDGNTSSYCSNANGKSNDTSPAVPCLS